MDVLIVGGGISGLTAADALQKHGKSVLVLEASAEVGGRTKTVTHDGFRIDVGGEHIGKRHRAARDLINELGLELVRPKRSSEKVTWHNELKRHTSYTPKLSVRDGLKLLFVGRRLSSLARRVRPDQPWLSKQAEELDLCSVGEWLNRQNVSSRVYKLLDAILGGFATTSIDQISLLHVLWWVARSGGIFRALRDGGEFIVAEGMQEIPIRLAGRLERPVVLNSPVKHITQAKGRAYVTTADGKIYEAKSVVVTVPIPVLKQLEFTPALPPALENLANEIHAPNGMKAVAIYKKEPQTTSRLAVGAPDLPLVWRDDRVVKGVTNSTQDDDTLIDRMSSAFNPVSNTATAWGLVKRWGELPWSNGTYVIFKPGQLVRHGPALNMRHGSVFFAGAERSSWVNSIEGAVESGLSVTADLI